MIDGSQRGCVVRAGKRNPSCMVFLSLERNRSLPKNPCGHSIVLSHTIITSSAING